MRHLSLFSGIGGIDLGFERAGIESVGQVEIDKQARSVLERHWPTVPRWEDVGDVKGTDLPAFDVLTGGFPCQDISVAGKRAGLAGDRSGLWFQFARIIGESLPSWVVIENVPGLLSSNRGRDMGAILGTLADYGYGFAYRVLDAQWFGVAQRRRRVFIVGHLGGNGGCQVLAVGQGSAGDTPPSREAGQAVAGTLELRPTPARGRVEENHLVAYPPAQHGAYGEPSDLAATIRQTAGKGPNGHNIIGFAHQVGGDRSVADAWEDDLSPTLPKSQTMAVAYDTDAEVTGPLTSSGMTRARGTETVESHHYARTASTLRRLTPVECARLQGFPDDWNDHLSDTQRYRQFGNAVCVNVAEWIGRRLMAHG